METSGDCRVPDPAGDKQAATRFQPGQSGNPAGRPRGSRNKLSEEFLSDLQQAWAEHGPDALAKCATGDPTAFCKIVGNLIPRQFESSLHVSLTAEFEAAASFAEAWRVVKQAKTLIGAKPVIELEAERRDAELSDE